MYHSAGAIRRILKRPTLTCLCVGTSLQQRIVGLPERLRQCLCVQNSNFCDVVTEKATWKLPSASNIDVSVCRGIAAAARCGAGLTACVAAPLCDDWPRSRHCDLCILAINLLVSAFAGMSLKQRIVGLGYLSVCDTASV